MSSLTIGGTAYRCLPWPKPMVQPAIEWIQDSSGTWNGSDRGASQDAYLSEVTFQDTDTVIDSLKGVLNTNREAITLSAFNVDAFSPNVNHTGSISASVVSFGTREHMQWAGTSSNVQALTVVFRALAPTLLGTSPSLATLRLQEKYAGDHTWDISKGFSYSQAGAYSDHKADVGTFRGVFQQSTAQAKAILAYLLVTARAAEVTLPTFPGVTYPFGVSRGTGPFQCTIPKWEISRKDLNRWLISIEFAEAP